MNTKEYGKLFNDMLVTVYFKILRYHLFVTICSRITQILYQKEIGQKGGGGGR